MRVWELIEALQKCDPNVSVMARTVIEKGKLDSRAVELVEQISSKHGTIVTIRLWSNIK